MLFKLPDGIPGKMAGNQEWADYAEFNAINKKSISFFKLVKPSLLVSDEVDISGVEDDSDKYSQKADEIAAEIRVRKRLLGDKYPFDLENRDYSIRYLDFEDLPDLVYTFLLLCTRIKMGRNSTIKGIDGALLFEHLSAYVAKEYFGKFSDVDVIGTSKEDVLSFREKLAEIFSKIGEGGDIHRNPGYQVKDDGVDIILWINFSDKNPSKFIAFGQCKTGTSWVSNLSELNVDAFYKKWFSRQPILSPVRMFFTAQYFPSNLWYVRASEAGLVFDRFRIMGFLPKKLDQDLVEKMKNWCEGAVEIYMS